MTPSLCSNLKSSVDKNKLECRRLKFRTYSESYKHGSIKHRLIGLVSAGQHAVRTDFFLYFFSSELTLPTCTHSRWPCRHGDASVSAGLWCSACSNTLPLSGDHMRENISNKVTEVFIKLIDYPGSSCRHQTEGHLFKSWDRFEFDPLSFCLFVLQQQKCAQFQIAVSFSWWLCS